MSSSAEDQLPALVARGVSKTFRMPEQQVHTLKERALHPLRRTRHHSFEALHDVSFAVKRGEFFGIAGRNGSGKSTLLKCVAGIYSCDGDIWRHGRISTFIELGVGFNPDLAARDNVITNGIMLGLTPREARQRYESVIEFAELREFEDLKLKNYSSGMHVRLAFSVAIHVDADILLVDEILAVGDAAFQQKCFDVFDRMRSEGKTLALVTHNMAELERFCDRALLLERGSPVMIGSPQHVGERYLELNFGRPGEPDRAFEARGAGRHMRVVEVWIDDQHEVRQVSVSRGERIAVRARVSFSVAVQDPQAQLTVLNEERRPIVVSSTALDLPHSGSFAASEEAVFSFAFDNVLVPGRYTAVIDLENRSPQNELLDRSAGTMAFVVSGSRRTGGTVDVPIDVSVDRETTQVAQRMRA